MVNCYAPSNAHEKLSDLTLVEAARRLSVWQATVVTKNVDEFGELRFGQLRRKLKEPFTRSIWRRTCEYLQHLLRVASDRLIHSWTGITFRSRERTLNASPERTK